jgi:dipeptidyl aminopeptidase/acylaminoacyl peptidase
MQTDVSDGLAALVRQGIVDAKRACIAGWNYGGYVAQAGVTLQRGLYRCGVSPWLLHEDTRLAMARASLDFVIKYNPPDAVAAPAP